MARQTGKDFSAAYEGVFDCLLHDAKGQKTDWLIAAPSERQSLESLEKWKTWAATFKSAIANYEEERSGAGESLLLSAAITFPHGSRVIAVPGKPETVRGFSANVLLTEFAFFEDPDATWRAIAPSITNPLRGGEKKVRIITTPNGIGNRAYDLWIKNYKPISEGRISESENARQLTSQFTDSLIQTSKLSPIWSCHLIDIETAKAHGLPVDLDQLRAALDDPDGWPQEFECQFIDVQTVLLTYETIASCESTEATNTVPPDFWFANRHAAPPLVMGIDFGRRRDLTVAWTNQRLGDVQQTVEVLELDNMSTPLQVEILRTRIRNVHRVCLDYTGAGVGLGDYLAGEFGEWNPARHKFGKIELCVFTQPFKVEIFSKLRMAFDQRLLRIPICRAIREDLHTVNRVTSPSGHITYRATHSPDGHADRCTALALAWRAHPATTVIAACAGIRRLPPHPGNLCLGKADYIL
ncbi:MAG: terminase family protein [Verrucomicrobiota bacterium]|jgi:phage FluMu gp28-like protein